MIQVENKIISNFYLENSELNGVLLGNKKSVRIGKATYSRSGYSDITVSDLKLNDKKLYSSTTNFINFVTKNIVTNTALKIVFSDTSNTTVYKRVNYVQTEKELYLTRNVLNFNTNIEDIEYIEYDMEFNLSTNSSKIKSDLFRNSLNSTLSSGVNIFSNCTEFNDAGTGDYVLVYDKQESKLTGVVSISSGSNIVNGTGTSFINEVAIGDFIEIGSVEAKVSNINSNTQLLLENNFLNSFSGEFIYKVSNPNESQISLIKGVYDIDKSSNTVNVENPFILKPNRTAFFKIGANKTTAKFSGTTINISALSGKTIFRVWLNGKLLTKNDYDNSITNQIDFSPSRWLRTSYNYYTILYYTTDQNVSDFYAKLQYKSYDKVFLLDSEEFSQLYSMCALDIEGFNSSQNLDYHIIETLDLKQDRRIKVNENNKLSFNVYIAFNNDEIDDVYILENLEKYLRDVSNFRIIRYIPDSNKQEIYNNVQLNDGVLVTTDNTTSRYSYSLDYQQRIIFKPRTFGDNLFAPDAFWGINVISQ